MAAEGDDTSDSRPVADARSQPAADSTAGWDGDDLFGHLVEHIQDAVVEIEVVDGTPIVRAVNPAFVDIFGYEAEAIVGESLNAFIVPDHLADEAMALDRRTADGEVNYARLRRETADGIREFLYRGIPHRHAGREFGIAIYTDLTDERRRERHLEVLNRVLRHNLRNELTVIGGAADGIEGDGETDAHVETIRRTVADLTDLVDEARTIGQVLDGSVPADASVDAAPLLRSVATQYRATSAATIEPDVPDALPVVGSGRLRDAFEALVENAIEHNPAAEPFVGVSARDGERAVVEVRDDAPSIPEAERAVVTGEADITPVNHGSGLGLWLVKWTVDACGGTLAFEERDGGGNVVRIELPTPPAD
jgi:PAS domain S-box-containing protein